MDIDRDEIEERPITEYRNLIWRSLNLGCFYGGGKFEFSQPKSIIDKDRENLEYFKSKGLL